MAETKSDNKPANKVPGGGDHDRVAMLSLRADGTPDQTDPEIIGDKDTAIAAAKEQFRTQAASAVDVAKREERRVEGDGTGEATEDPSIEEVRKAQESAVKAAESAAESTVKKLHDS